MVKVGKLEQVTRQRKLAKVNQRTVKKTNRKLTIKYWKNSFQFIVVNLRHFSYFLKNCTTHSMLTSMNITPKMVRFSHRKFTRTRKVTTKALGKFES